MPGPLETRRGLETEAARLATERMTDADRLQLLTLAADLERAEHSTEEYVARDVDFHHDHFAAREATERLAAQGCRRIAIVSGPTVTSTERPRSQASAGSAGPGSSVPLGGDRGPAQNVVPAAELTIGVPSTRR